MTVASTLPEMLAGITAVGDDLRFFSSVGTPSILIGEMTARRGVASRSRSFVARRRLVR